MLEGITVVNLAVNLPGPAAAQRLSRMGARVIKVEPPSGDPMGLYCKDWYQDMAAGHEIIRLDLKQDDGMSRLHELLAGADILLAATRPSAMKRLGLDFLSLTEKFPTLCQVSITGYPAPKENEAGHDLTYQAVNGLVDPPHMPRTLISDMAGSERVVSAALALLLQRELSGKAGEAVIPLSEAAEMMAEPLKYGTTSPGAILGGGIPEYNIYKAKDGWVALAALESHFKKRLEDALNIKTAEEYSSVFAGRTVAEWQVTALKLDLPIEAVSV